MYGLVNKAIEQLILTQFDQATWNKILEVAGVEDEEIFSMESYPDSLTYSLVGAASQVVDIPADELLEAFGEYWTLYTAEAGYGPLLEMTGSSFEEFVSNIDQMHGRIALSYTELRPPSFRCEILGPGRLHLHYHSERAGLAPMVIGLVKGLGKRFEIDVSVEHLETTSLEAGHDVFGVKYAA